MQENSGKGKDMRYVKLLVALCLLVSLCLPSRAMDLDSAACLLMDAKSGRILYEKDADEPRAIASLTKIMTLVLILEEMALGKISPDDVVVASPYANSMTGTRIWLEPYEKMTLGELVYSVAVGSANDAAVALAEHIAGTEADFVLKMNQRALELGLTSTSFGNSTGLPAKYTAQPDWPNYSTAKDMARLCQHAITVPGFLEYVSTYHYSVREGRKPQIELWNLNKILERTVGGKTYGYIGVDGIKTGTTTEAGYCIGATALRDNLRLIAVILGADNEEQRTEEATALFDYGFRNFQAQLVTEKEAFRLPVKVPLSATYQVEAVLGEDFYVAVPKGAREQLEVEAVLIEGLAAPLEKGEAVGYLVCRCEGVELGRAPLLTSSRVKKGSILHIAYYVLRDMLVNLLE